LMSGGNESVPFALVGPIGKVVQSDRPLFQWRKLEGSEGYVVSVYDNDFNRIAVSPTISATAWRPDRPLPRGRTYIWQITAIKDGGEVKSPVRPAPDARFKVLDYRQANDLSRVAGQFRKEYLLLGILYAKAGLFAEAEREFRRALAVDPNSKSARKFLNDVRKLK
jgi:tetratricopeptide (TPR) repeat protein